MAMDTKEKKNSDRAKATRKHIVEAYLHLMQHRHWARISVKDLCEEAAVTRGTFYQYYNSIKDLMEIIENETLYEIQSVLTKAMQNFKPASVLFTSDFDRDYSIDPSQFTIAWFRYCMDNKDKMYALLNKEFTDGQFVARVEQIIARNIAYFMKSDGLPNDVFHRQYVRLYTSNYIYGFFSWISDAEADTMTPEDMAIVVDSIRTGGIYTARRTRMRDYTK